VDTRKLVTDRSEIDSSTSVGVACVKEEEDG
jgi:hypothetical protein